MYQSQYIYVLFSKAFFFIASPIFNTCPQIQKLRYILITFYFEKNLVYSQALFLFFKNYAFYS